MHGSDGPTLQAIEGTDFFRYFVFNASVLVGTRGYAFERRVARWYSLRAMSIGGSDHFERLAIHAGQRPTRPTAR
jgi:hypothetical protein